MVQTPQRLRLLLETAQQIRAGPCGLDDFPRDPAPRLVRLRLVDRAGAALAQQAKDAAAADGGRNPPLISRRRLQPMEGLQRRRSTLRVPAVLSGHRAAA